jgi:hypothetical protein
MFFRRHKRGESAAELANEAEIEKLAKEATLGELGNEVAIIDRSRRLFGLFGRRPVGFFNNSGVDLPDDKPYEGDGDPRW